MNNISSVGNEGHKKRGIVGVFKGLAASLLISFVAFALMAFLMLVMTMPEGLVGPIAVIISLCSVFVGAYLSAKVAGEKGWLWGGICGLMYYIVIYISALSAIREFNFSFKTLIMLVIGVIVGMVGGIFGINTGGKKKRR